MTPCLSPLDGIRYKMHVTATTSISRYEKHGNRSVLERVLRKIKRRTIRSSNCFGDANAETADDWLRSFSFARNQLIRTLPVEPC